MLLFTAVPAGWYDHTAVSAAIGATGLLLGGTLGLWFQQRNRRQDKTDGDAIQRVSNAQGEIRTAFEAWQAVSAANTQQIANLTSRLTRAEERADKCEGETVPALREEVGELQAGKAALEKAVQDLNNRLGQRREGDKTT